MNDIEKEYEGVKGKHTIVVRSVMPDSVKLDTYFENIEDAMKLLKREVMQMVVNDDYSKEIRICVMPNQE